MKKFFTVIIFTCTLISASAQRNTPDTRATVARAAERDDMLQQSKKSRTAAIIMVSAGSTMAAVGMVMMVVGTVGNSDYYYQSNNSLITAGAITGVAGLGLALGSIPVFIKSHRLRKEAKLVFAPRNLSLPLPGNQVARVSQMQLSLKIPLGR